MARKKKPLPLLENITITGVAAEGKAIAKVDNLVVFVPSAVPGDEPLAEQKLLEQALRASKVI